jgi:hypothetical protein
MYFLGGGISPVRRQCEQRLPQRDDSSRFLPKLTRFSMQSPSPSGIAKEKSERSRSLPYPESAV